MKVRRKEFAVKGIERVEGRESRVVARILCALQGTCAVKRLQLGKNGSRPGQARTVGCNTFQVICVSHMCKSYV